MSFLTDKDQQMRARAQEIVAALPEQTPETIRAEADRVRALAATLGSRRGGLGGYLPTNQPQAISEAQDILGFPFYRERDPSDLFGRVNGQRFDYTHRVYDLREMATLLDVLALSDKPYPLGVCGRCKQIISWPGDGEICDDCSDGDRRWWQSTKLPSAWFGSVNAFDKILDEGRSARRYAPLDEQLAGPSRLERLGRYLWARKRYRMKVSRAWNALCSDPGNCGPLAPEEGFTLYVPVRCEQHSSDMFAAEPQPDDTGEGAAVLIRMFCRPYTWRKNRWVPAERADDAPNLRFPNAFDASLPIEALMEAWHDFCDLVYAHNAVRWQRLSAKRELEDSKTLALSVKRESAQERLQAATGTLELMDGTQAESRSHVR